MPWMLPDGAGLRRVHVAVGVEPDEPDLLPALAVEARHAGDGAHGDRVVAAQHDRASRPSREDLAHAVAQGLAGRADLLQVLHPRVARVAGLLRSGPRRPRVVHVVAQLAQRLVDARRARKADGPMSTPRRPAPRSRGTPMSVTLRGGHAAAHASTRARERRPGQGAAPSTLTAALGCKVQLA